MTTAANLVNAYADMAGKAKARGIRSFAKVLSVE
jgi:hypothetical protein